MSEEWEAKREAQERLILLVLGVAPNQKISMLHLEKEVFLLWNFHPMIKDFINFVAYFRGPYSSEIIDVIKAPYYLTECWEYHPPSKGDNLSGGFVTLTRKGLTEYKKYYSQMLEVKELHSLLAGIKIVRTTYDDLSEEELLLLVYDTYPSFRTRSTVAKEIFEKRDIITDKLIKRGIISEEKGEYLRNIAWYS